jgi:hypothetical protein
MADPDPANFGGRQAFVLDPLSDDRFRSLNASANIFILGKPCHV